MSLRALRGSPCLFSLGVEHRPCPRLAAAFRFKRPVSQSPKNISWTVFVHAYIGCFARFRLCSDLRARALKPPKKFAPFFQRNILVPAPLRAVFSVYESGIFIVVLLYTTLSLLSTVKLHNISEFFLCLLTRLGIRGQEAGKTAYPFCRPPFPCCLLISLYHSFSTECLCCLYIRYYSTSTQTAPSSADFAQALIHLMPSMPCSRSGYTRFFRVSSSPRSLASIAIAKRLYRLDQESIRPV